MKETPIITGIKTKTDRGTDKWMRVVFVELETEDGPLTLRITAKAAHDLRDIFKDLPPAVAEWRPAREL